MKMDSFDDRLILQKAVYLSQAAGVDLGYFYRWYLHGPYCRAAADDGFAICEELSMGNDPAADWALDPASSKALSGLRASIQATPRVELPRKLELLASVHYLVARRQVKGRDPRKIVERLRRFQKDFSEEEVSTAIGEMRGHGIPF